MKASELIKELQALIEEHGDMEVYTGFVAEEITYAELQRDDGENYFHIG